MNGYLKGGVAVAGAGLLALVGVPGKDKGHINDYVTSRLNVAGQSEVLQEMPKGALERLAELNPFGVREAVAGERVSVDEYYRRAKPADDIMPGARVGGYKDPLIRGTGLGFDTAEWIGYYTGTKYGPKLKEILSKDKNAVAFADYFESNQQNLQHIIMYKGNNNNAYVVVFPKSKKNKLIFKIQSKIVDEIRAL